MKITPQNTSQSECTICKLSDQYEWRVKALEESVKTLNQVLTRIYISSIATLVSVVIILFQTLISRILGG